MIHAAAIAIVNANDQRMIKERINEIANELIESSKHKDCFRIKIDDIFITTSSNKIAWKKIGHAKSALRLHFEKINSTFINEVTDKEYCSYTKAEEKIEKEYQDFLKNRVEFVKI